MVTLLLRGQSEQQSSVEGRRRSSVQLFSSCFTRLTHEVENNEGNIKSLITFWEKKLFELVYYYLAGGSECVHDACFAKWMFIEGVA